MIKFSYCSNTLGASGNQLFFTMEPDTEAEGILFFQVFAGGTFAYSFLFSNTIDSTYADGTISRCNLQCPAWKILNAGVCVCSAIDPEQMQAEQKLTFAGSDCFTAEPGMVFSSDPVQLHAEKGQYLAVRIRFSGTRIPYYEEIILSAFRKENGGWVRDHHMPMPCMAGCDRAPAHRIGYFGDSITAGIGTEPDSYTHWNAVFSELLGQENAYWNLGIGYARASDAASGGIWMQKALQNDLCFVCFGVNDIYQGATAPQLIADLQKIVNTFLQKGKPLLLQTVPPGDYDEVQLPVWNQVNDWICALPQNRQLMVFDNRPILSDPELPQHPVYSLHPNAVGCRRWAQALYDACRGWLETAL